MNSLRHLTLTVLMLLFASQPILFAAPPNKNESEKKFGKWQYLFRASQNSVGTKSLPKKSKIQPLEDFEITGAQKDINLLNIMKTDGKWGISQGVLTQLSGRSAAIKIGTAQDFELEAGIEAQGIGGWFILFGLTEEGNCYGVYNVTMKVSGSPWRLSEFRNFKGILESDREVDIYECRGKEAMKLRIVDGEVSLTVGNRKILKDFELANYQKGDIIIGTYDTQYGPKPVKIYGVRLRTIESDQ